MMATNIHKKLLQYVYKFPPNVGIFVFNLPLQRAICNDMQACHMYNKIIKIFLHTKSFKFDSSLI